MQWHLASNFFGSAYGYVLHTIRWKAQAIQFSAEVCLVLGMESSIREGKPQRMQRFKASVQQLLLVRGIWRKAGRLNTSETEASSSRDCTLQVLRSAVVTGMVMQSWMLHGSSRSPGICPQQCHASSLSKASSATSRIWQTSLLHLQHWLG